MIRTYRTLAIRAIVWSQLVIMAAMIASGSIFSAGVLLSAPQVISGVEPIASTFAEVLIYGFTILFVYVMIARVVRRRMLSRAPTREGIRERLQRLGAEVSSRMSVRREVVFVVGRGGSNAYVRKKRIVVGEKLLLDSTDSEIEGLIGHELGHISKNHLRKKAITTRAMMALAIVAVFLSSFWRELPIVLGTVLSFVSVISIPLNWKYEYEADAMAAETLGEEVVILALTKLQTKSFDGISLTHPPLSWRIRRVKAGLHQKENSSCP